MTGTIFRLSIAGFAVVIGWLFLVGLAQAQPQVSFPIPELGGCADQAACKVYCDDLSHTEQCLTYAEQNGLMNQEEVTRARQVPPAGPGGCTSDQVCRAYCTEDDHREECLTFAKEHGLLTAEEVNRVERINQKTGPGGCRGEGECRAYCETPEHQEECIGFAEKEGFMSKEEATRARKLAGQPGPGGCRGEACKAYCEDPTHLDECLVFGEEHGFIDKQEAARIRKSGIATGPGGCRGEACKAYCDDSAHQEECLSFADQHGLMDKQEIERARKMIGKTGPGGCQGQVCRDYCERPENNQACLEFAEKEGLIPQEEATRARKALAATQNGGPGGCQGQACRAYCDDQAHRDECFRFAKEKGLLSQEEERQFEVGAKIQSKLAETGGPGGCRSENDCHVYCADATHTEECIAFAAQHGGLSGEEAKRMVEQFVEHRSGPQGSFQSSQDLERFKEQAIRQFEEFKSRGFDFSRSPEPGSGFPPEGQSPYPQSPEGARVPRPGFQEARVSDRGMNVASGGGGGQFGQPPQSGGFGFPQDCRSREECEQLIRATMTKEMVGRGFSGQPPPGFEGRGFPPHEQGQFAPPNGGAGQFGPPPGDSGMYPRPQGDGSFSPPGDMSGPPPQGVPEGGGFAPPPAGEHSQFTSPPGSGSAGEAPPPPPPGPQSSIAPWLLLGNFIDFGLALLNIGI